MRKLSEENAAALEPGLSRFPFLNQDEARELVPYLEAAGAERGKTLWMEGDSDAFAAFIVSGRFEKKQQTEFAEKQIVVGVYGAGAVIGQSSLLDDHPRPQSAVCLDEARLFLLSRENYEKLLQENPRLGLTVLKGMCRPLAIRLRKSFDRLAAIF